MLTARHIISDIRGIASSGGNSDDFKASNEQILFWINEVRSMLISQALDKRADIADIWVQTLPCFAMSLQDISDCCEVTTGCYGLKSVLPVPNTIGDDQLIMGVYTIDGETIDELTRQRARYSKYNKYTKNKGGWFIKDGYLYIVNNTLLETVTVAGIWEDPSDLSDFSSCGECWTIDSEYPCSLKMASTITDIVVKTKCQTMNNFPMDQSNNASGATPQQVQQNKIE